MLTGGRLNANNALQFGLATPVVTIVLDPLTPSTVSPGGTISIEISVTNNGSDAIDGTVRSSVRLDDGREIPRGSRTGSLDPGETLTLTQSAEVPLTMSPGTTLRVYCQVETAVSFDENWVEYTIVP